ncbi:uncharacterized protein PRCAT00002090001 [Priceomyces carsonii]|uniref:uncharacterized protein n=1 Tax=Priceomyces carsonii TaxID=28549 RepID=UPI002ED8EDD0|nr:unnamed protein product [Priceomyces carsonii]
MNATTKLSLNSSGLLDDASNFNGNSLQGLVMSLIGAVYDQKQSYESKNYTNAIFQLFTYCSSLYGLCCLIMAIILNRTLVFASTNNRSSEHRERKDDKVRNRSREIMIFILRFSAIVLLLQCFNSVLVALNFNSHAGLKNTDMSWFHYLLPDRFFAYDPLNPPNKYMVSTDSQGMAGPTSDMYWPIFLTICYLTFIETFISVIQGKRPYTETGFTIFEHSLAFHEASFGATGFFASQKVSRIPNTAMLVLSLYLVFNHSNIQIGGLLNDNAYRLIPLTISGLSFMVYFIYELFSSQYFPIVIFATFLPQLLILAVICLSLFIFILAVVTNGFSLKDLNCASFLFEDNEDLGLRNYLSFNLDEDFQKAFLNCGVLAIILAGKSSYISELSPINTYAQTWVEKSFWQKLQEGFGPNTSDTTINRKKGYDIFVTDPEKLLMGKTMGTNKFEGGTSMGTRVRYLKEILLNTYELLYGIIIDKIICGIYRRYVSRTLLNTPRFEETEEEFEERKKTIPTYLVPFARRKSSKDQSHDTSQQEYICLDQMTDEQIEEKYIDLIQSAELPDEDYSRDYSPDLELEDSDEESIDIDLTQGPSSSLSPITELFTGQGLNELISASTAVLNEHLSYERGILTRSKYRSLNHIPNEDESLKLLQIIALRRSDAAQSSSTNDDDVYSRYTCVICQCNPREIITWPCKCFAICETCRLSLVSKGIEGCVCCRKEVHGVSKVFIL